MKENEVYEIEKLKDRLDEIKNENEEKRKEKLEKDRQYYAELKENEEKRLASEKERKKLKEEEEKIQETFSNKVGVDIAKSKRMIGFLKRYVLIGIITGVPGIGLTYLWDKWQESKMVKNLCDKNLATVANPNNRELAKEYEMLRRKFNKAYNIDKIEKLLTTSEEIEKLKHDKKLLEKLNQEIKKYREEYEKNLDDFIENQIIQEKQEVVEEETITEEDDEPEIRR